MYRKTVLILAAATMLALAGTVAAAPPNVNFIDVRALGMGGAGITTQNNFSALMYNPALLAKSRFHLDIATVNVRMGKDIVDMFKVWDDNQEAFENYADTTEEVRNFLKDELAAFDDNWMGFGAYPQVGLTFPNFAIGAYAATDLDFKADMGILEPRAQLHGIGDYVFTGGLAFKLPVTALPNTLYGGAALKIIKRYEVWEKLKASDVELDTAYDSLIEDSKSGWGVDLGLLYELIPERVELGAKIEDVLGKIDGENMPMIVNVGASLWLSKGIVIAADYNDFFFHDGENIFNKLNFGAQIELLPILDVRGGFGQGYPSLGAGLNLGIVTLDAAVYGIERTDSPGGDGDYNYAARLKIGI
ncbi:MAG: hypothetical protein KAU35_06840 [candidate division Zixibacteria bacterium]|nr:hypothetical protein [candidate division Zixibacteria bacterium]